MNENWDLQDFLDSLDNDEQRERVISQLNLYHHYVDDYTEDELEELECD